MEGNESESSFVWKMLLSSAGRSRNAQPSLPPCSIDGFVEVVMDSLAMSKQQAIKYVKEIYPNIFTSEC